MNTIKISRKQHTIDATNTAVGRVASQAAVLLMGKHKPTYQKHIDGGDLVIIENAKKVKFTGLKLVQKLYYKHTQYLGHLKTTLLRDAFKKSPEWVLRKAVYNMLPKNRLRAGRMKRLQVKV